MKRREFLRFSAVTGATAALDSCGKPEHRLIRFVPEEDLTPGVAVWKPSICTLCPAGCGTKVRVMEGEAEVVRKGQLGLVRMGLAKKLEGNPQHPISQGKLCPRGQAGPQVTYHPDRVKNPLKRTGPRGSGQFREVSWEEALQELVAHLAALYSTDEASSVLFLTRPLRGQRRILVERFLSTFGASPPLYFEPFDDAVLRWSNFLSFGLAQLPTLDLAHSNYVMSFGADFLGTWNSPVAQAVAYGEMRQGRPGTRAKFVQIESRMSLTGANADEWIPARTGSEGVLALGLAHVILKEKLRTSTRPTAATPLIAGWSAGLPDYTPQEVEKRTGVAAGKITRLAREMASQDPAVALIGGAPLAHTNGSFNALAVNALNALLGSIDTPGGILFTPEPPAAAMTPQPPTSTPEGGHSRIVALVQEILLGTRAPKVLLVYDANPIFATPAAVPLREALKKIPFIASFGGFIDETSALADLILPDHSPLESWLDHVPESGTAKAVASLAPPAMRPLHNTRAMADLLLDVAHQLGKGLSEALPWRTFEEMVRAAFNGLRGHAGSTGSEDGDEFWKKVQEQGGWWSEETKRSAASRPGMTHLAVKLVEAEFDGPENEFPFHFLPYPSQMLLDGSLANLPWMQETPDPISTAMWSSWVEINPRAAERLGIRQGDLVEVASRHGKVQAPALLSPGLAPDVLAMPVGQGHEDFGRYASQRGANPLSILAPAMVEPETRSLAWAATRVKASRVGRGELILFAGGLSRFPYESERR